MKGDRNNEIKRKEPVPRQSNRNSGRVVTAKVVVDIGDGKKMTSTISMDALKDLELKVGSKVTTLVKASFVILMA